MIRRLFRALPDRALMRVVGAPSDAWTTGFYEARERYGARARRCLVGHLWGGGSSCADHEATRAMIRDWKAHGQGTATEHRFDALVARLGLDRARELCQAAARKELRRRGLAAADRLLSEVEPAPEAQGAVR